MARLSDADRQRLNAAVKASFDEVRNNVGDDSKRMAGAALAAVMAPTALAAIDNQEEDILAQLIASPVIAVGGTAAGGLIGYHQAHLKDEDKDTYTRNGVKALKETSKERAREVGPQQAIEEFANAKADLLKDISPVGPKHGQLFNKVVGSMPEYGPMLRDIDIPNRTRRELRGMTRGALIGALASIAPAYGVLRGGELPME